MSAPNTQIRAMAALNLCPVIFMISTMVVIYLIYTLVHCRIFIQEGGVVRRLIELVVFHIHLVFMVICYVRCILTAPGHIPDKSVDPSWEYELKEARETVSPPGPTKMQESKRSGERRHCKWCAKYKPDRCHHCRVCRTCVLKMDHHCPWIANCVGFRNHKFFFLLLHYSTVVCHLVVWSMLDTVRSAVSGDSSFSLLFTLLFGETLAAFIGLLVTCFYFFHIWLMLQATTTIEFCEKSLDSSAPATSRYDRGVLGNIKAVLGDNPWLWLFPCSPPSGSGLKFISDETPLNKDIEAARGVRKVARNGSKRGDYRQQRSEGNL